MLKKVVIFWGLSVLKLSLYTYSPFDDADKAFKGWLIDLLIGDI